MTLPLLSLFTSGFGLLVPAIAGWLTVPYDATRQYISELGAIGVPNAAAITGLLALVAVLWLTATAPPGLPVLLLLGLAVGNKGAALVPCDLGCPAEGTRPAS